MVTKILTKDFLTHMTLEEVKRKIKKDKKGFHDVEFIDGSSIITDKGVIYVTTRMSYRFKLNYNHNNIIRLEKAIHKAKNNDDIDACKKIYNLLSVEQQRCVSQHAMNLLAQKEADIKAGVPVTETKRQTRILDHDTEVSNIIYCKNKSIQCQCFKSFQYNVHTKQYRHPETHYYLVHGDSVTELLPSDPIIAKELSDIKTKARILAGKKASETKLVYAPLIDHILTIDGDK